MTPEEIERTMEFILQQQAKNEVEIQDLKESVKELKETTKLQDKAIEEMTFCDEKALTLKSCLQCEELL